MLPGGNLIQANLNKTGAIDRAGAWLDKGVAGLGLSWTALRGLFLRTWEALSFRDFLPNPRRAFDKVQAVFTPTLSRVVVFARAAGNKLLEFVLEGALKQAGPFGAKVMAVLKQAGVVDAGGQGFVDLLDGMWNFMLDGKIGPMEAGVIPQDWETEMS